MAIIVAVASVLILGAAAFTVDLGMQRVVRSDMQSVADVVALDMARQLGVSSGVPGGGVGAGWNAALKSSIDRQSDTLGHSAATPPSPGWACNAALCALATPGWTDGNGLFTTTDPGLTTYDAVQVVASADVRFSLHPGEGSAERSAVAQTVKNACFSVDSYAAQLMSGNSAILGPITKLLGTNLDTTVLSSSGIATTSLDALSFLTVLGAQVGVGSTDQLLTTNVTAAQVLTAEATALSQQDAADGALQALQSQFIAHLGSLTNQQPIQVGELVGLQQGGSAALGASLNAFDLAMSTVYVANGTNAISLPATAVTLPAGLGSADLRAYVVQGPQTACGTDSASASNMPSGATATTAQTRIELSATVAPALVNNVLTSVTGLVGSLASGLVGGTTLSISSLGPLTVDVGLAQATGTLREIVCSGATPTGLKVDESAQLAPLTVRIPLTVSSTTTSGLLSLGGSSTSTASVVVTASTVPSTTTVTSALLHVPGDYDKGAAGPTAGLGSVANLSVDASAVTSGASLVNSLFGTVQQLANSVISPLLSSVLPPLASGLTTALQNLAGVTLGGTTFTPLRTPSCGQPVLVH